MKKTTLYTLHTDHGQRTLCTSADWESLGLLTAEEIEEAAEAGEALETWPEGVWIEPTAVGLLFKTELFEMAYEKKISFLSWDDAGMAFKNLKDAEAAIAAVLSFGAEPKTDEAVIFDVRDDSSVILCYREDYDRYAEEDTPAFEENENFCEAPVVVKVHGKPLSDVAYDALLKGRRLAEWDSCCDTAIAWRSMSDYLADLANLRGEG